MEYRFDGRTIVIGDVSNESSQRLKGLTWVSQLRRTEK
jgi:hypothetical protein